MDVTFVLHLFTEDDYEEVPEEDLRTAFDAHRGLIEAQEELEGAIRLRTEGEPDVDVADMLGAAVQNLCFSAPAALLADPEPDCFLYRLMAVDSPVVLVPYGPTVRVLGEGFAVTSFPTDELLPALVDCGLRVLDLFRRIGGRQAGYADHLQPFADEATAALARRRT